MKTNNLLIQDETLSIIKLDTSMYYDIHINSLDENNRRFVPDEVFETLDIAKEVVDQLIECYNSIDGPYVYAIIRNKDNKNIGYVQLVQIEEGWEIGYHIAIEYCNNGYASKAVSLFLQYLKENTDIKEIYGVALKDNKASIRVLSKNGFNIYFDGVDYYQGELRPIIKSKREIR
ncbi:MAG: GNAT family N-acetyltransferase [Bacilli bacterium]|nr:GNAT family N-acetyltransferase [Bacilli bacterium]